MEGTIGEVLTIQELAVYLKISRSTIYKLVREGKGTKEPNPHGDRSQGDRA